MDAFELTYNRIQKFLCPGVGGGTSLILEMHWQSHLTNKMMTYIAIFDYNMLAMLEQLTQKVHFNSSKTGDSTHTNKKEAIMYYSM